MKALHFRLLGVFALLLFSIYFNDKINKQTNETYLSCVIQVSRVCSLISPLIFILHYLIVMDYPAVRRPKSLPIDFHIIQKRMEGCGYLEGAEIHTNNTTAHC